MRCNPAGYASAFMRERSIMSESIDLSIWQGRVDPEAGSDRWHQRIQPLGDSATPGLALLGMASDAGVARNQGRPGAQDGPAAIRRALANLAWHRRGPAYDAGDVVCDDDTAGGAMERAQAALAERAALLLDAGHLPMILGGGHDLAFASWQAVARHLDQSSEAPRVGIINLDAHFDLRDPQDGHSSGTPFAQIADDCAQRGWPFRYACFGISQASNTAALYQRARRLGVQVHEDRALAPQTIAAVVDDLQAFIADCDHLYLSFDLDVLPASEAPGVSAPAARGVSFALLEDLIDTIRDSGKLRLADVAELNPHYDIDQRTARIAARFVHQLSLAG